MNRRIFLSVFFVFCMIMCSADTEKGEVAGKVKVADFFYINLEDRYVLSHGREYIDLYNKKINLRIKIDEIIYSNNYTKASVTDDILKGLPDDFIRITKNSLEYFGFYEYAESKDGGYHSFIGEVLGDKSKLTLIFIFQDINLLEKVKKIWISCSDK
jgi:hypothetical protein